MALNRIKKTFVLMLLLATVFLPGISFASSDREYRISDYDVNVTIISDGSLKVTESIRFSSLGGNNNAVILIDKQNGDEIDIKNVYLLKKDGYIKCERLSAGQWDANVFTGTYSVIREKDVVRVKVYGPFSGGSASLLVQYNVKNGIKRYGDVAEYRRYHVQKNWDGYISDISIEVNLPPKYEKSGVVRAYLHGMLVGQKSLDNRTVSFNIPDTVPGEYVEARIVFPEDMVRYCPVTDYNNRLQTIIAEEAEYNESDKSELLRARENAAREAGRRAMREKIRQRTRFISSIISLLASLFGIYVLFRINKTLRFRETGSRLDIKSLRKLSPAVTRFLISNGKLGTRAFLGNILVLANLGCLKLKILEGKRNIMIFGLGEGQNTGDLSASDKFMLDWIREMCNSQGWFNPDELIRMTGDLNYSLKLKQYYNGWENLVRNEYSRKNKLDSEALFYRNLGLIMGTILFFLGCVIPVALAIWAGYSMIPVGFSLFLYTLRIQNHTGYSISQYRTLKILKKRILNRTIRFNDLPVWITGSKMLLAYIIALGAERELELVKSALKEENDPLPVFDLCQKDCDNLEGLVNATVSVFNRALSSLRDA